MRLVHRRVAVEAELLAVPSGGEAGPCVTYAATTVPRAPPGNAANLTDDGSGGSAAGAPTPARHRRSAAAASGASSVMATTITLSGLTEANATAVVAHREEIEEFLAAMYGVITADISALLTASSPAAVSGFKLGLGLADLQAAQVG